MSKRKKDSNKRMSEMHKRIVYRQGDDKAVIMVANKMAVII